METLFFPAMKTGRPPRATSREPELSVVVVALIHALGVFALMHINAPLTLRQASAAGGGLRVTLVSAPRPVQPSPLFRPIEPMPPVQAPIVTSHRPSTRTVAAPLPKPPERQPAAPAAMPSPAPAAEPAAPPPAPVANALNLPGAQAIRTVASVSCDIAQPPYPASAKRLGHEGSVMLQVTIDPTGRIIQADIAKSSGFEELDAAARQTMLAGHCKPYVDSGIAMTVHAMQPLTFNLDN
ncbi:TonB family protein [Burkholderia sp. FERM BP-3421]|uniref:energy transducer TonB n=1 Tax=Burkholderia sp. FERM BP-3421 TaxID=1494466 RepID=UPI002361F88B|nr:energy transducer TonB [Burkholderia sp. FERM BP-3421]WDD92094.1 TonB family protein [Burkholderia sp. FERM BP-3421]